MKTIFTLLFILTVSVYSSPLAAQNKISSTTAQLLKELDGIVEHKQTYRNLHEQKLSEEKLKASQLTGEARQQTYYRIFKAYARFQTDSAMVYLNKMVQTPPYTTKIENLHRIGRAEIYAVTGSYPEALAQLQQVNTRELDHTVRLEFYHLSRTLYGWMADFAVLPETKANMNRLTCTYRDSILMEELPGVNRNIVLADSAIVNHLPQLALNHSSAFIALFCTICTFFRILSSFFVHLTIDKTY